jgi:hypothetical protein
MKSFIAAAVLSLSLAGPLSGPAFAFHCPADIAKIDAALQTASLSDADKAKVMELRNEGERLHQAGQHQQSVDTLAQAMQILGIM